MARLHFSQHIWDGRPARHGQCVCVSHCLYMRADWSCVVILDLRSSMLAADSHKCAACPTAICDINGHDILFPAKAQSNH